MSVVIDGYEIDAFISVDPSFQNQITPHPIEDASEASDHVITRPLTLAVTGIVSDTPIGAIADIRDSGVVHSTDAYERLSELHRSKRPITIETNSFPKFENMVMRSFNPGATASTGESLQFRAVFEQISFVNVAAQDKVTLVSLPAVRRKKKVAHAPAATEATPKSSPAARDVGGIKAGRDAAVNFYNRLVR